MLTAVARQIPPSGRSPADPAYADLVEAIEVAFRQADPAALRGTFPSHVKVYLASLTLKVKSGYYGGDQVLALLRRGFAGRTTVRFRIEDGASDAAGGEVRRLLRARWLFKDDRAARAEARLAITLAQEAGLWTIREIRESK